MKVVVIGSSNIDMVAQVNHLPAPGETVGDASFMQSLGGKGANQAVAAARLGGSVTFITSLGNDMYAEILKKHFKKEGITTDYIIDDVNQPTGTALIFVADSGENCIAVAPGANYSLLPGSITHFSKVIDEADIIVMQAEIPYETIKKIALSAKKKGKKGKEVTMYKIGRFTFDTQKQVLAIDDKSTKLTTKESELLSLLCAHVNEILERNFALKTIWIDDNYFNARSMDVYITKLRKHLKDDPSIEIINIHGKGYKLIAPDVEAKTK